MAIVSMPSAALTPPPRKKKRTDEVIDHMFMALPARGLLEIVDRLNKKGLNVTLSIVRKAVAHLRRHSNLYEWTIPHVKTNSEMDNKYFVLLIDKDKNYHTDPCYRKNLAHGTDKILLRVSTESKNQREMLLAAATATYVNPALRAEYKEMADDCEALYRKANRVIRMNKAAGNI